MTQVIRTSILFGIGLAAATPAQAITFATGQGTDGAGCGAVTAPCRTLQQAVTNAPTGGYVVLQGPAYFGSAQPGKSLSIVGERGATTGDIDISGAGDTVVRLRGLTIDTHTAREAGVSLRRGARLEIVDCVIRNSAPGDGIVAIPWTDSSEQRIFLSVVDSVVEQSSVGAGIRPGQRTGVSAFIDGLRAQNNGAGVGVISAGENVARAVVTNSAATNNHSSSSSSPLGSGFLHYVDTAAGVPALPPGAGLFVVKSVASGNTAGVSSKAPPGFEGLDGAAYVSRSVIVGNDTANGAAKVTHSYGGNVIRGNVDDTLSKFTPKPLH